MCLRCLMVQSKCVCCLWSVSRASSVIRRYPYNLDFDYGALEGLQKFSINNLGDPFIESNYGVHSREFEVKLMTSGAALYALWRPCVSFV